MPSNLAHLHAALVEAAQAAGRAILEVYETDFAVRSKEDRSPLTEADLRSHEVLTERLRTLTPEIPILSEESRPPPLAARRAWKRYWLLDPLDGTKDFVSRNGEFTVNIALIEGQRPVLGVVGAPVAGLVFLGDAAAGEAYKVTEAGRQTIATRPVPAGTLAVVATRNHGSEQLERYLAQVEQAFGRVSRKSVGSSLKLCMVAQGEADFYPRLGPTSEWDIAAGEAVLLAAGGAVRAFDDKPLAYNARETFLNPYFFAVGDAAFPWRERLPPAPEE